MFLHVSNTVVSIKGYKPVLPQGQLITGKGLIRTVIAHESSVIGEKKKNVISNVEGKKAEAENCQLSIKKERRRQMMIETTSNKKLL